jgi:hypothetical protein
MLAVTDRNRGDKQVRVRFKSGSICFHSSFVCRKCMEIKIYVAVILLSVLCGCRTWSLNARRKCQEAGQNCVTYFIICTLNQTVFGSSNVIYIFDDIIKMNIK